MPTETEIEVSYSRRVQLEQFEPIEMSATVTVDIEEDDDIDDVYDETHDRVEDMVERSLAERVAQQKFEDEED